VRKLTEKRKRRSTNMWEIGLEGVIKNIHARDILEDLKKIYVPII
jgi:hypothetical protein